MKGYNSKKKGIRERKRENLVPRVQDRRKKAIVKLRSGSIAQRGKGTARWCIGRSSRKHSKREE